MKIIPFSHIIHTLRYPQYTQKSEHLKQNTLPTPFMKWVDLTPPFVWTHFHTTLPFSDPSFHMQIWTSWLLHFFLNPPPWGRMEETFTSSKTQQKLEQNPKICYEFYKPLSFVWDFDSDTGSAVHVQIAEVVPCVSSEELCSEILEVQNDRHPQNSVKLKDPINTCM